MRELHQRSISYLSLIQSLETELFMTFGQMFQMYNFYMSKRSASPVEQILYSQHDFILFLVFYLDGIP